MQSALSRKCTRDLRYCATTNQRPHKKHRLIPNQKKQCRISEILKRITGGGTYEEIRRNTLSKTPSKNPLRVGCVNEEVIQKWYNSLCYNNAHNLKDYATKGNLHYLGKLNNTKGMIRQAFKCVCLPKLKG